MTDMYNQRTSILMKRLDELAAVSEDNHCITRRYGTPAFLEGAALIRSWMDAAGLITRIDNIGNVRGKKRSTNPNAKTLVIASHMDTVVNAGKFDGPLGVLMGIDIAEHATDLPFHLEVIAFADEEGCRFHTTYLGSKVVAGSFETDLLQKKDATGFTVEEVIQAMKGNPGAIENDAIPAEEWLGYFEVHIEQGPVLYTDEVPVAMVTAIAGQARIQVTMKGFAGHAGTVPMDMRKDALCAAAEAILAIEWYAKDNQRQLVATVGKLDMLYPASNVISGEVQFSVDVRSADALVLEKAVMDLQQICNSIGEERMVICEWQPVQQSAPVQCSGSLNEALSKAIQESGYELVQLVSGAGHDAVPISAVAPVTMLFVRCFEGISHNPLENATTADIAAAMRVADRFLVHLQQQHPM